VLFHVNATSFPPSCTRPYVRMIRDSSVSIVTV